MPTVEPVGLLRLRQSNERGFFVEGLTEKRVTGPKNVQAFLNRALNRIENQHEGQNGHAVFTITLSQLDEDR